MSAGKAHPTSYQPSNHPLLKLLNEILAVALIVVQGILFLVIVVSVQPTWRQPRALLPLKLRYIGEDFYFYQLTPDDYLSIVLKVVGIGIVMILLASQAMRYRAWKAQQKKEHPEKKLFEAAGLETPEMENTPPLPIPAFWRLSLRNTILFLVVVPLLLLAIYLITWGPKILVRLTWDRHILKIITQVGFYASFGFVFLSYRIARHLVDSRLITGVRPPTELAEESENLAPKTMLGGCLGQILGIALLLFGVGLPVLLIAVVLERTTLPLPLKAGIVMLVMVGGGVVVLAAPYQYLKRHLQKKIVDTYGEQSSEAQAIQEAYQAQENSTEGRLARFSLIGLAVGAGLFIIGLIIAALIIIPLDLEANTRKNILSLVMIMMMIVIFGGVFWFVSRISANPAAQKLSVEMQAAGQRGDYETAIRLADELTRLVPTWETRGEAGLWYVLSGRLDEGEKLVRAALSELLARKESDRQSLKPVIALNLGILGNIQTIQGHYNEAEATLTQAAAQNANDPIIYNSLAELTLYRSGSPIEALAYLDRANAAYQKQRRSPSSTHLALRAWATALNGDISGADTLMQAGRECVAEDYVAMVAEFYYYGGHVLRAQGKLDAAQQAFERSVATDPNGLQGILARRQLE